MPRPYLPQLLILLTLASLSLLFSQPTFALIKKSRPLTWVKYDLNYTVKIPKPRNDFKKIELWIPLPKTSQVQELVDYKVTGPSFTTGREKRYNNEMLYFNIAKTSKFPVVINISSKVNRRTDVTTALKNSMQNHREMALAPSSFLSMNRKVPINGIIADLGAKVTKNISDPEKKILKIYDYVAQQLEYDKSGTGWGKGDAIWACTNKRGNCTDFHSLMVGMARSQKIPAQFQIGLPIPPSGEGKIPGYHCWAKLYLKGQGWIPVDASESKKAQNPRKYFGYLPPNRIHFTTGRDINLVPQQASEPLNYFIYPHMEQDGKAVASVKTAFSVVKL